MTDQSSIFGSPDSSATQTPTQNNNVDTSNVNNAPVNTGFADLLSQIKNERGEPKYRTVEDAIKGAAHAQSFISTLQAEKQALEAEAQRLREEAAKAKTLEETLAQLTSQQPAPTQTQGQGLSEEQLAELITRQLTQREKEAIAKQNLKAVVSTLQQSFGSEAEAKFYGKAAELGLSKEEVNALASKSPQAVYSMLGIQGNTNHKSDVVTPTTGTINSSGVQPNPQTFVKRNEKTALVGATTEDLRQASFNANKMVEEVHAQGKTIHDLTDPKEYFKHFGK